MMEIAMKEIKEILAGENPCGSDLRKIENILLRLAKNGDFSRYRKAAPGEELTYELDVPLSGGPALYLVSDGYGSVSPPHRHGTWAVIVGIDGVEMNQIYETTPSLRKDVQLIDVRTIGKNESIVMEAEDIHGIVSTEPGASFHLHLYGCSLSSLPPFSHRVYKAVPVSQ